MITVNSKFEIFVKEKLQTNDHYILNERDDYTLNSFKNFLNIYNKLSNTDLLFDYFPKFWSFVFYKDQKSKEEFYNIMYEQLGYDYIVNSFNQLKRYQIENNIINNEYKNNYIDYIELD